MRGKTWLLGGVAAVAVLGGAGGVYVALDDEPTRSEELAAEGYFLAAEHEDTEIWLREIEAAGGQRQMAFETVGGPVGCGDTGPLVDPSIDSPDTPNGHYVECSVNWEGDALMLALVAQDTQAGTATLDTGQEVPIEVYDIPRDDWPARLAVATTHDAGEAVFSPIDMDLERGAPS